MFHTVYDSWELGSRGRAYIGKHSTNDPYDDYKGSFKDKSFAPDNKIVIAYATTPQGAVWLEMMFQRVFSVAENPQFANKSYQTSDGFVTGFKGKDHPMYGKQREDMRGDNNPAKRPEVSEKISQKLKGKPKPSIQGDNHYIRRGIGGGFEQGENNVAKKPEVRKVLSEQKKGEGNPAYGRRWWVNRGGDTLYQQESPGSEWQNGRVWKG